MKTKIKKHKVVNIDLDLNEKATKEQWDRHEGLLVVYGNFLFQNKIGDWAGRETAIGKPHNGNIRTNFWCVLEKDSEKAFLELKKMVKNFKLTKITKVSKGEAIETKIDYKKRFEKNKTWSWEYFRLK